MRLLIWVVLPLLFSGCAASETSETDRKQVLWCIGACIAIEDTTDAKDLDVVADDGTTDGLRDSEGRPEAEDGAVSGGVQ